MTQAPATPGPALTNHRGGVILALGILSIVFGGGCGLGMILGIIAWIMGNSDMRDIDAGVMDPSGRGIIQAGKICGIIGTILGSLVVVIWILYILFFVVLVAAGAASGAGGP